MNLAQFVGNSETPIIKTFRWPNDINIDRFYVIKKGKEPPQSEARELILLHVKMGRASASMIAKELKISAAHVREKLRDLETAGKIRFIQGKDKRGNLMKIAQLATSSPHR